MPLLPIEDIAAKLHLPRTDWVQYGEGVAKLRPEVAFIPEGQRLKGKLVLVSAITPTPAGEGKTTISIGLSDGLSLRGKNVVVALRQPSLGPTLGSKGGGAGGGRSRLEPFERVNLGLTGDIHAVTSAHNLLASMADNGVHFGDSKLEARKIDFPRVIDLDDRVLRDVLIGLGGPLNGIPRETRFDITAASEVMAVLSLARDFADLKRRLGRIRVGWTKDNQPVFASDVGGVGGMAVVLREALLPNLLQTHEGTPALVHGGPFGNIAHGCSSIVQTRYALSRADIVVTEAGFGFDLGAEKFLDIKCRVAGLWPHAFVLVATLKALKFHGGADVKDASKPNLDALKKGFANLKKHVESARVFGLDPVVAINLFPTDQEEELRALESMVTDLGCKVARASGYTNGAEGGLALADVMSDVLANAPADPKPHFLYDLHDPLPVKIEKIAKTVYGASGIELSMQAQKDLAKVAAAGLAEAPVCMAKTHLSLTADPKGGGIPKDHVVPIQAIRFSSGAGFVVPLCGDIMTMPGLGRQPAVLGMDLTDSGEVIGLK
ncbi:MAG: formate--tetrahydrofolate ligase [Deltaproteobacteria bacterium]|nr:formate--tetrahydrofolate ligase [Deltaproteobacteria bacterium]